MKNKSLDKNSELIANETIYPSDTISFSLAKKSKTKNVFLILPDDVMFILLQFCNEEDITETRELQSEWIQKCTKLFTIKEAVQEYNLPNMTWIKERLGDSSLINFGTFS